MAGRAALAVEAIATAPAIGRAVVTAVHIRADYTIYVACSRHGVLLTDTYGDEARLAEIRMAGSHANLRAHAHAAGCTARRSRVRRPLTDATRESTP